MTVSPVAFPHSSPCHTGGRICSGGVDLPVWQGPSQVLAIPVTTRLECGPSHLSVCVHTAEGCRGNSGASRDSWLCYTGSLARPQPPGSPQSLMLTGLQVFPPQSQMSSFPLGGPGPLHLWQHQGKRGNWGLASSWCVLGPWLCPRGGTWMQRILKQWTLRAPFCRHRGTGL